MLALLVSKKKFFSSLHTSKCSMLFATSNYRFCKMIFFVQKFRQSVKLFGSRSDQIIRQA